MPFILSSSFSNSNPCCLQLTASHPFLSLNCSTCPPDSLHLSILSFICCPSKHWLPEKNPCCPSNEHSKEPSSLMKKCPPSALHLLSASCFPCENLSSWHFTNLFPNSFTSTV